MTCTLLFSSYSVGRKYSGIHLERALCCRLQDFTKKLKSDLKCVPCIKKKSYNNFRLNLDESLLKLDHKMEMNSVVNEEVKVGDDECCKMEETEEEIIRNRRIADLYYIHHPSMLCTSVKFDTSVITTECAILDSTPRSDPGSGAGSDPGSGAGSDPGSGAGSDPGSGAGSCPDSCEESMKGDKIQTSNTLQEVGEVRKESEAGRGVGADFTERRCVCWWLKMNSPMNDWKGESAGLNYVSEDHEDVLGADRLRTTLCDKLEREEVKTKKSENEDTDNKEVGNIESKEEKDTNMGTGHNKWNSMSLIHDIKYGSRRGNEDLICVVDSQTGLRSMTMGKNKELQDKIDCNPLKLREADNS